MITLKFAQIYRLYLRTSVNKSLFKMDLPKSVLYVKYLLRKNGYD